MALLVQPQKRVEKFGLEFPMDVNYPKWEPGGEYTKMIILKNVKIKTQKIKYRVSSSNTFFSAIYPQPIVLSAGNTYSLPITFRPTEKCNYKDLIEFQTLDGIFSVPLYAFLPQPNLTIPETLSFGLCAVKDTLSMDITITNTGLLPTEFHWECSSPFEISSEVEQLGVKESCKVTISYSPQLATVHNVTALCHYGDDFSITKSMKLQGTSKYPNIYMRHTRVKSPIRSRSPAKRIQPTLYGKEGTVIVEFGEVSIGNMAESTLELINTSMVPACFSIEPETDTPLKDTMFTFGLSEGIIPPLETLINKVYYSPSYSGQCSTNYYKLLVKGGINTTRLICTGEPRDPCVSFEEDCLDFGSIECGQTSSTVLHITNTSPADTMYQFLIDDSGVFYTEPPVGDIKGHSTITITISFTPPKPHPYHKVITCLILNQEPLHIDVIGTAFTENIKPVVLKPHHITQYQSIASSGLSKFPPEYLEHCIANNTLIVNEDGFLTQPQSTDPNIQSPFSPLPQSEQLHSSNYKNYMQAENEPFESCHVSIDEEYLDFGFTLCKKISEKKAVAITNHTEGPIYCVWMTDTEDTFQVLPAEREIPPNSTAAFNVSFWPNKPNHLFSRHLECYLCYKTLRDYTLLNDDVIITLPWCLQVTAMGHSFPSGVEPFVPALSFDSCNVVFPSTIEKESSYRTLVGRNRGDTPIMYRFTPDPSNIFNIKPECGLITDTSQLFVLSMTPKTTNINEMILNCTMNSCTDHIQEILLSGQAERPRIVISKGDLYFKPTLVGDNSCVQATLTNPCGLTIRLVWSIKTNNNITNKTNDDIVMITPSVDTLLPRQSTTVTFKFTPKDVTSYSFKAIAVTTFVSFTNNNNNNRSSYRNKYKNAINLFGKGTTGSIECLPTHLDCGSMTVGTSLKKFIVLQNISDCKIKFKLGVSQVIKFEEEIEREEKMEIPLGQKLHGLELSQSECHLEPHSHLRISLTFRPSQPSLIKSHIYYQTLLESSHNDDGSSSSEQQTWQLLCNVTLHSVYPSLHVMDVRSDGGGGNPLSKSQIWDMLQVDRLNYYLNQYPSPEELRYAISTRHSLTRKVQAMTRAVLEFNFGTGPLNPDHYTTVYLLLVNKGNVQTKWAFQFPADMYLEPEYWAETGCLDKVERHQYDVVRNGLYSVSPKEGLLASGDKVIVKCSYRHSHLGLSQLPVLLKINRGREILLNFTGFTSPVHSPSLTCLFPVHTFAPVPISTQSYPVQFFQLTNFGDTKGAYYIDTSPLDDITRNNFDMPILKCEAPEGSLSPRCSTSVPFVFSPTEAKVYTIDLMISFSTGQTMTVTFQGEGIDPVDEDTDLKPTLQSIPECSNLTLPDQFVEISQERFNIGNVPLFAVVRRLLFLKNQSEYSISYHWEHTGHLAQEAISIYPASGYLQPDQMVTCRVTFHALSCPAVYDVEIACKIINESYRSVYVKKLEEWERKNDESKHTFTIIDPEKKTNERVIGKTTGKTYKEWQTYHISAKSKSRTRHKETHNIQPPQAPIPQYLHLGITARTHTISDYCKLFTDFSNYTIDQESLTFATPPSINDKGVVSVKEEESDAYSSVLTQMLRELLKDANFQESIGSLVKEPIPYFAQFNKCSSNSPPAVMAEPTNDNELATRHIYAAGLECLPSATGPFDQESSHSIEEEEEGNGLYNVEGSDLSIGLPVPPPPLSALNSEDKIGYEIKNSTEFQTVAENIGENILLNIIRESLAGEVDLSAPIYTIAKPPKLIV